MGKYLGLFLFVGLCATSQAATECETGWIPYKDESCIKGFPDLLTYNEARQFCSSHSTSGSTATLVTVKEEEMQQLLADYTQDQFENFWLGGKYDNSSAQFKWEDGEPVNYTNWAGGYPRNLTTSEYCIQLVPANAKSTNDLGGKWEDAICQRRSLPLCQRPLPWSLEDATREILKLRRELEAATYQFSVELEAVSSKFAGELDAVNARVVPVGSIYIEYYNQPSPASLWPTLSWQDVTSTYAGLFFRASGGGSGNWGATQAECAPRISQMHCSRIRDNPFKNPLTIPANGWSEYGYAGTDDTGDGGGYWHDGLRFHTDGCEVRPKNQAIRLWKRTA